MADSRGSRLESSFTGRAHRAGDAGFPQCCPEVSRLEAHETVASFPDISCRYRSFPSDDRRGGVVTRMRESTEREQHSGLELSAAEGVVDVDGDARTEEIPVHAEGVVMPLGR